MQQNIVNENKYTGFGTKKTYSSITKTDKDGASERNAALEKSIEVCSYYSGDIYCISFYMDDTECIEN